MFNFQIVFSSPLTSCLESSPHREVDEKVDAAVHLDDKVFKNSLTKVIIYIYHPDDKVFTSMIN